MAIAESKRLYTYKDKAFTRIERVPVEITDTSGIAVIGEVPRCFLGSSFKVYSAATGGIEYQSGIDYVLSQSLLDIQYSKMVEQDCYSGFKFTAQTGIVYVSADIVASYSSGEPINELFETTENHAATLLAHDAQFTAINNKNNEQDLRLSAAETVNNAQNVTLDDHEARLDNLSNVTNDAQLKRAAGDLNSFAQKTVLENSDVVIIEDASDGYTKKKVNANQFAVLGGGGGDVFGPASSVSDDIALFDGATGKLLKDSGRKLNTGAVAGTVPVRDTNGAVPGNITGTAVSLAAHSAGYEPDWNNFPLGREGYMDGYEGGTVANHGPSAGIAGGSPVWWNYKTSHFNARVVQLAWAGYSHMKNRFQMRIKHDTTWSPWTIIPNSQEQEWYFKKYILAADDNDTGIEWMADGDIRILANSAERMRFDNTSTRLPSSHMFTAGRGLKNTLYEVNWSFAVNALQEFNVYQPIFGYAAAASNTFLNVKTNTTWAVDDINNLFGGAIFALTPGRYRFSGVNLTSFQIARAPSQTASDVIEFF